MVTATQEIEARKRKLEQELHDLDSAAHPLREKARRDDIVAAMQRERHGVEVDLAGVLRKPEHWRETVEDSEARNGWALGMTRDQLADTMRARLAHIDDEIARITGHRD